MTTLSVKNCSARNKKQYINYCGCAVFLRLTDLLFRFNSTVLVMYRVYFLDFFAEKSVNKKAIVQRIAEKPNAKCMP